MIDSHRVKTSGRNKRRVDSVSTTCEVRDTPVLLPARGSGNPGCVAPVSFTLGLSTSIVQKQPACICPHRRSPPKILEELGSVLSTRHRAAACQRAAPHFPARSSLSLSVSPSTGRGERCARLGLFSCLPWAKLSAARYVWLHRVACVCMWVCVSRVSWLARKAALGAGFCRLCLGRLCRVVVLLRGERDVLSAVLLLLLFSAVWCAALCPAAPGIVVVAPPPNTPCTLR